MQATSCGPRQKCGKIIVLTECAAEACIRNTLEERNRLDCTPVK